LIAFGKPPFPSGRVRRQPGGRYKIRSSLTSPYSDNYYPIIKEGTMNIKSFAFVGLCFGLICCAVAPVSHQVQNSFPIQKPFESVWTAIIETFAELNLPIMNMDKASGLITTDWMSADKTFCDCGSPGFTTAERETRGKFNVFLKKVSDDSCEMKINCNFKMIVFYTVSNPKKYRCVSTGKVEGSIYKSVSEKLK